MATSNVFSGIVTGRTPPGAFSFTTPSAVANAGTLLASELLGGINVSPTAGANAFTLPTGTSLGAALFLFGVAVGDTFEFINISPNIAGSTISGAAGMTLVGLGVTASAGAVAGGSARFLIRCMTVPTDATGAGATFNCYQA